MLEDSEEGGVHVWHLVRATEEPEGAKVRRGSLRERERAQAKAIPEIYLTRLLSMKVSAARSWGEGVRLRGLEGPTYSPLPGFTGHTAEVCG